MTGPAAQLPPLATRDQLKRQVKVTSNGEDEAIDLYLQAASNLVRNLVVLPSVPDEATEFPSEAVLSTLLIAEQLWDSRRGGTARPGMPSQGGQPDMVVHRGYAIPRAASQLLSGLPEKHGSALPVFSFPPPYDRGGWLHPGLSLAFNGSGVAERVLPATSW